MVYYIQYIASPHYVLYPQIKVQDLEGQLLTEMKRNKEHIFQVEQLRKDITQHK